MRINCMYDDTHWQSYHSREIICIILATFILNKVYYKEDKVKDCFVIFLDVKTRLWNMYYILGISYVLIVTKHNL